MTSSPTERLLRERSSSMSIPKDQRIDKTELGKFELTFQCQPNVVSLGEQKCFIEFAEHIGKKWEENEASFDDEWFKRAAAKSPRFSLDGPDGRDFGLVQVRPGLQGADRHIFDSLARLHLARVRKSEISLEMIWDTQTISDELGQGLLEVARQVARKIKDTPPNVKNIGEYCKQEACWTAVQKRPLHRSPTAWPGSQTDPEDRLVQ